MFTSLGNSIPRNGLVGEWLLDGNALDTSGSGYNGTATNVTYGKTYKGYQNQCGIFNGSSSYVSIADNNAFTFTNGIMSFSGTFKTTGTFGYIVSKGSSSNYEWAVFNNAGNIYISLYTLTGTVYKRLSTANTYNDGLTHTFCITSGGLGSSLLNIYIDGKLDNGAYIEGDGSLGNGTSSVNIGRRNDATGYFNGGLGLIRIYNRVLTLDEIQLLHLEGNKRLGPTNIASYPKLFEGLVGYFENPTGTTELWNIANGVNSTRVAGNNTTDNLGNNRALSNPNYTWTSITYTTGYTFENSGSGWSIVTNPLGLLGTGINRVTTLRNVFLFTRTLSSDEVTLLQNLCNSNYIYPNPSYDLPNLRDGLVLDLNEQGMDLSGNGNNATLVNSPLVVRQGKVKGLGYNGSSQRTTFTRTGAGTDNTYSFWFNRIGTGTGENQLFMAGGTNVKGTALRCQTTTLQYLNANFTAWYNIQTISNSTRYHLVITQNSSGSKAYINGVLIASNSDTNSFVGTQGSAIASNGNAAQDYFNGRIINPRIRNRELSAKEIQALYYSQKGNFIY